MSEKSPSPHPSPLKGRGSENNPLHPLWRRVREGEATGQMKE